MYMLYVSGLQCIGAAWSVEIYSAAEHSDDRRRSVAATVFEGAECEQQRKRSANYYIRSIFS